MADGPRVVLVGTEFGARTHVPALRAAGFVIEGLVGRNADKTRDIAAKLGIPRASTSLNTTLFDELLAI